MLQSSNCTDIMYKLIQRLSIPKRFEFSGPRPRKARTWVRWNEASGGRFTFDVPVRKDQNRGVDLERSSEDLGSFDSEVDPISFDGGDRGLRDAGESRKLILAQLLQLTNNPDGFTDGDLYSLTGFPVIVHDHFFR